MKHLRILLVFISLAVSFPAFSQDKSVFMGNWVVTKVVPAPEVKAKKEFPQLEKAFLKAVFRFKTDGSFIFEIPIKELSITNAKWTYYPEATFFSIDGTAPNLMNVFFRKEKDNWVILIDDDETIKLEVKKVL